MFMMSFSLQRQHDKQMKVVINYFLLWVKEFDEDLESQSLTTEVYFKVVDWSLKPENKIFALPELPPGHCKQFGIKVYCDRLEGKLFLKQHLQNSSISLKSNLPIKDYALVM